MNMLSTAWRALTPAARDPSPNNVASLSVSIHLPEMVAGDPGMYGDIIRGGRGHEGSRAVGGPDGEATICWETKSLGLKHTV